MMWWAVSPLLVAFARGRCAEVCGNMLKSDFHKLAFLPRGRYRLSSSPRGGQGAYTNTWATPCIHTLPWASLLGLPTSPTLVEVVEVYDQPSLYSQSTDYRLLFPDPGCL